MTSLVASMAPRENVSSIGAREQQARAVLARCADPSESSLVLGGTPPTQWACALVNAYLADRG